MENKGLEEFDSLLKAASDKKNIVKCKPFMFRLILSERSEDKDNIELRDRIIEYKNEKIKSFQGTNHDVIDKMFIERLNGPNTDHVQGYLNKLRDKIIEIRKSNMIPIDIEQVEVKVEFIPMYGGVGWAFTYAIPSVAFKAISIGGEKVGTTIYYIDHFKNAIETISFDKSTKLEFLGFDKD